MFRVQAEVGLLPRHVSGENVVVFVPGDGVAVDGESELQKKRQQQRGDANGNPGAAADFHRLNLHRFSQFPSDTASLLQLRHLPCVTWLLLYARSVSLRTVNFSI